MNRVPHYACEGYPDFNPEAREGMYSTFHIMLDALKAPPINAPIDDAAVTSAG